MSNSAFWVLRPQRGAIAPRKRYQILNNGGRKMPRAKQTMDGNTAAAHVAYAYTDVAAIYPHYPVFSDG